MKMPADAHELLSRTMVCVLATAGPSDSPHAVPMWYRHLSLRTKASHACDIRFSEGVSYAALVSRIVRWTKRPTSTGEPDSTASAGADAPMRRARCTSSERGCWLRSSEYGLRCLSAGAFDA